MNPEEQEQLEGEVDKSRQVKQLKNAFLDKFFEDKERQIFNALKELPLGSNDDLNNIHMMLKSMMALKSEVNTAMNTGKLASIGLSGELDKTNV